MVTIIGACLLAVLLVVAGLTVLSRNRARLQPGRKTNDRGQRIRKEQRAQSRHDRRRR